MITLLCLCLAQDVDQKKVDQAIDRGVEYLLKQEYKPWDLHEHKNMRFDELVLYTLLHAGADREHPVWKALLKNILETELERTCCVSLQAMFLSELDPAKYQARIAQCCQFLVDNQCANGQWEYGEPTKLPSITPGRQDVATGGKGGSKPRQLVQIKRQRAGKASGDNSNSQYAVLGLRACLEANVLPPRETLDLARKWWEAAQNNDCGWGYTGKGSESYGSMTAGAVGSLVILRHYLKLDWKSDPQVVKGVRWMTENFTVKENAKTREGYVWHYYYLYAIERAGVLTGLEKFGARPWYREGALQLLSAQGQDGSWSEGNTYGGAIKDTCFAILFLRRATVPLPKTSSGK